MSHSLLVGSLDKNCVEFARFITDGTLNALFLVNSVEFLFLAGDGLLRALPETNVAAVTVLFVYLVIKQLFTDTAGALLVVNSHIQKPSERSKEMTVDTGDYVLSVPVDVR